MKKIDLSYINISLNGELMRNLSMERLIEEGVVNGETKISMNGAAMVDTGEYTGRSPKDKYIVKESSSENNIWWGDVNQPISEEIFDEMLGKVQNYYNESSTKTYIFDGFAGADIEHRLPIRIVAKKAWQAHFANNMFIRPSKEELVDFNPGFTIINASDISNENFQSHGMNSETFILFNLKRNLAIIGGTEYGGEMKKGIFSVLHYILPLKGILSMHCSANVSDNGDNSCLFFGLSGTGKTTLSTDSKRPLIGDDEHGWSDKGIFNFEGGCYAKVINLNKEYEPDIYNAISHGALLENVVYDLNNKVDFTDSSKTENTRVSYPINHIKNSMHAMGKDSVAGHPSSVIFLTCDAFGVMPPVAKLSSGQAMYHFISGYTAKVAGTERGITEPQATFSPCFGGPFLTLHPLKYAELLKEKMNKHGSSVYLVNTGWIGGSPSSGASRISIKDTRCIIDSILSREIDNCDFITDNIFGFDVPVSLNGIEDKVLNPRECWENSSEYDNVASKLSDLFRKNFEIYGQEVQYLVEHGPVLKEEA